MWESHLLCISLPTQHLRSGEKKSQGRLRVLSSPQWYKIHQNSIIWFSWALLWGWPQWFLGSFGITVLYNWHLLKSIFLFLVVVELVAQLCPTVCDPVNCSPPGSSVHGILQARILEWIAIPFSRWSSQPRDQIQVSWTAGRFFTIWATWEALQDLLKQSLAPLQTSWVCRSGMTPGNVHF